MSGSKRTPSSTLVLFGSVASQATPADDTLGEMDDFGSDVPAGRTTAKSHSPVLSLCEIALRLKVPNTTGGGTEHLREAEGHSECGWQHHGDRRIESNRNSDSRTAVGSNIIRASESQAKHPLRPQCASLELLCEE